MDRRELIKAITVLTGAAFVGGDLLISGCREPGGYQGCMDYKGETVWS